MPIVKDKDGRDWKFPSFTVGLVLDIRDQAGLDLFGIRGKSGGEASQAAGELVSKLYDPLTLGSVLWVLLGSQAKDRDLDERGFGYAFEVEQYTALRQAILESILDFTLPPRVAGEIRKDLPGVMATIEDRMIAAWRNSASGLLATSGSTPGLSA